jgi:hypothetical protein
VKIEKRNLFLIAACVSIAAATAWSVYNLLEKQAPVTTTAVVAPTTEGFMKSLYDERLKEEGNRTALVERLIEKGVLSDKKALYFKTVEEQPR